MNTKSIQSVQSSAVPDRAEEGSNPGLDEAVQGALGRKLRESYDEVVREQVPDKFLQLLSQLKQSEAKKVDES